jgi:hypothetical protein
MHRAPHRPTHATKHLQLARIPGSGHRSSRAGSVAVAMTPGDAAQRTKKLADPYRTVPRRADQLPRGTRS